MLRENVCPLPAPSPDVLRCMSRKMSVLCPHSHLMPCSVYRGKCLSFTLTPCYDLIFDLRGVPGIFPISVVSLIFSIPPLPPYLLYLLHLLTSFTSFTSLPPLPPYFLYLLTSFTSLPPLPPYLLYLLTSYTSFTSFTSLPRIPRIPRRLLTFPSEAFNWVSADTLWTHHMNLLQTNICRVFFSTKRNVVNVLCVEFDQLLLLPVGDVLRTRTIKIHWSMRINHLWKGFHVELYSEMVHVDLLHDVFTIIHCSQLQEFLLLRSQLHLIKYKKIRRTFFHRIKFNLSSRTKNHHH